MEPLNPCELKIDLFCRGLRIGKETLDPAGAISRTQTGLSSGLELILPGRLKNVWVNAPVKESFAAHSPYRLHFSNGRFEIKNEEADLTYPVEVVKEPGWYSQRTSSGRVMSQVGVLQGTYLGVYIGPLCRYWTTDRRENCSFCSIGLDDQTGDDWPKTVSDVVETCITAHRESGIRFVHLNSGYQEGRDLELAIPFVHSIKEETGLNIGLQAAPVEDLSQYDRLIDAGVDHFSFGFEFMSEFAFTRFCSGKARTLGQESFFRAMDYTAQKLGKGRVGGEIIAGVEPIEETMRAIDRITSCGAYPTVCVFRPLRGTDMAVYPPPFYHEMREVFKFMIDQMVLRRIPIGMGPDVEVSLVVQPSDTIYLASPGWNLFVYRLYNSLLSSITRPVSSSRLRESEQSSWDG